MKLEKVQVAFRVRMQWRMWMSIAWTRRGFDTCFCSTIPIMWRFGIRVSPKYNLAEEKTRGVG